jgi:Lon-like protease
MHSADAVAPAVRRPDSSSLIWAVPLAVIAVLGSLGVIVAGMAPSTLVAEKPRCVSFDVVDGQQQCASEVIEDVEFALVPAVAEPVDPRLSVTGAETFGGAGEVLFVTVRAPDLSLLEWAVVRKEPAVRLQSYFDRFGDQTPQQQQDQSARSMRTAKQTAEFVALQRVGLDVTLVPGEVVIDAMVCFEANAEGTACQQFAPSDEVLDGGDTLRSLAGVDIVTIEDLTAALEDKQAGDLVDVVFERDGVEQSGQIELSVSPDDPSRTIVGFFPLDTSTIELPEGLEVDIDTDSIGGPSAGLAFTLTLIDELSTGDLLGGKRIAVTGEIDINGNVGAIGGLASKASAVQQMGVDYFLVPTSQGENDIAAARKVVGDDVQIIPVATLDEALQALARLGGDPLIIQS